MILAATGCASSKKSAGQLTPGVSYTSINYKETGVPDYSASVLTGKLNYQKAFELIEFGSGTFYTLHPLTKSPDVDARFLGINARLGLGISLSKSLKIGLFGGGYYTTMSVEADRFGFKNLAGPQAYTFVRKLLGSRNSIDAYGKYAWVKDSNSTFSGASREFAVGGGFTHLLNGKRPISLSADYSELRLQLPLDTIALTTVSVGLGIGIF